MIGAFKIGLRRKPKGKKRPILARFALPLRRYLLVSSGIGVSALALAIGIAILAYVATDATPRRAEVQASSFYSYHSYDRYDASPSIYFQQVSEDIAAEPAADLPAVEAPAPVETLAAPPQQPSEVATVAPFIASVLTRDNTIVRVTGKITNVNITFYDCKNQGFCGNMANGRKVYEGAAACSWNLAIGTKFTIVGDPTKRIYVCEDRGLLSETWVDIFWHDPADGWRWQAAVGRHGTIEIVEVPH